jgi:hypothetical protein
MGKTNGTVNLMTIEREQERELDDFVMRHLRLKPGPKPSDQTAYLPVAEEQGFIVSVITLITVEAHF